MQNVPNAQEVSATSTKVSLDELARLTGFSPDIIREELFVGGKAPEGVCLEELRAMMLKYIDATLVQD